MALHAIRVHGDPVLRQPTAEVTGFDAALARLAGDMIETMYDAPGVGLAANQIGVQKSIFVWDVGSGPRVAVNPVLSGHTGEWTYDEGCLSVPGLYWPIARPGSVHLRAQDLDGGTFELDGEEILARVFLHEVDHLQGKLLIDRLDPETKKEALAELRNRDLELR
ncbi:MAG TPA: peptide deformylase [Acidimicrobiales bacterium]|nr:peptide deformylase [Acidimicrobiales bacterium]